MTVLHCQFQNEKDTHKKDTLNANDTSPTTKDVNPALRKSLVSTLINLYFVRQTSTRSKHKRLQLVYYIHRIFQGSLMDDLIHNTCFQVEISELILNMIRI